MTDTPRITAFSVEEAIRFGWQTTLDNWKPLVALAAVEGFLSLVSAGLDDQPVLRMAVQVLQTAVGLVMLRAAFALHDHQPFDISRPTTMLGGFWPYLLTMALTGLAVVAGLVALIVPGIIVACGLCFAPALSVDAGLDPVAAVKESWRITTGHRGQLFLLGLALVGINVVGALAMGVGLLVTVPLSTLATVYVLRRLRRSAAPTGSPGVEVVPPDPHPAG